VGEGLEKSAGGGDGFERTRLFLQFPDNGQITGKLRKFSGSGAISCPVFNDISKG
jgi:hypothetical protein